MGARCRQGIPLPLAATYAPSIYLAASRWWCPVRWLWAHTDPSANCTVG